MARVIVFFLFLCLVELLAQLGYRVYKKSWFWVDRQRSSRDMVIPHPYFAATLRPGASEERDGVRVTHNSRGFRGAEFEIPKPAGKTRVVCLGGSTTYGVGVSDHQTWEHCSNQNLGSGYEFINMGGPGGTSLEASLQAALLFSDLQPDYACFLHGWNDARVQHVKNLAPDWSDFHGRWIMGTGVGGRDLREYFATTYFIKRGLVRMFFPHSDSEKVVSMVQGDADRLTARIDQRALGHYDRNLRNIVALCKRQGVKPVFIPQVLNWPVLTSEQPYGWLPFIRDKDLRTYMDAYNATMEKVAKEEGAGFIGAVRDIPFVASDWIDNGHFSPAGHQKFAKVIAAYFKAEAKAPPASR